MANEFVSRNGIIALKDSVVSGSLNVTQGITGSLFGTASWSYNSISSSYSITSSETINAQTATTASHALTASSADNLTVRGTLTAETLVVQTITSSVSWITGSTEFGSIITNTHEFTGSVSISGSLVVNNNSVIVSSQTSSMTVLSASNALTASYALNAGAAASNLISTGSITASVDVTGASFRITSGSSTFLYVSSSGNLGLGTTFPTTKLHISSSAAAAYLRGSGSAVFAIDGNSGRLFSVDDSLSGSLFSVNTIAGLPVIEAFSDNTVRIGQYGQRGLFVSQSSVGIGTETPQFKLDVTGSARFISSPQITGSLDVSGSARFLGTAQITGSLNVTGSITSTGTITAQTLVVQVVTSSVSFITGSTRFGSLITNTHTFTGSVNISGSSTQIGNKILSGSFTVASVTGSLVEFQATEAGVKIGASSTDTHTVTGSLSVSGSVTGTSIVRSGGTSTQALMADGSVKANPTGAVVATSQTTGLTTYTDLATAGPTVTVTIGASGAAIVILTARTDNTNSGIEVFMGFAVSGATTVAASDAQALCSAARNTGDTPKNSAVFWVTGLTAGSNTFTSKYRTTANTATFADRNIIVIPI
jgi:hypothetical protein